MRTEAEEVARNLGMTHSVLASLKGFECSLNEAVCALLTAATTLIDQGYPPEARLGALNQFLEPTIQEWAQGRGPIEVTIQ